MKEVYHEQVHMFSFSSDSGVNPKKNGRVKSNSNIVNEEFLGLLSIIQYYCQ